ncbi:transposase [Thermoplasma volcanium]|uniref:transposase n=1 Tax=Thermoplasma volcanium TaxID=50339 RepID=UPI00138941DF|nr:transposase [Thermoplasma volcanium]
MDIMNSAMILEISWFQEHGIMRRAVNRGLARKSSHPSRIGIDEKYYGKHHRYITLVFNHDDHSVEFISLDRKQESLDLYYRSIGEEASGSIEAAPMDMWDPFIVSTKSNVTDAESKIVFDRFHVMKHMNMALDDVRWMESRMAEYKEMFRKTRCLWLYSPENLPDKYGERYEILKESDLKTARVYAIKENLRNLWNCSGEDEARSF